MTAQETRATLGSFFVPGKPRSKGRPFVTKAGATFTPAATKAAEESVLVSSMGSRPEAPWQGPVFVQILFQFTPPKSPKWRAKQAVRLSARHANKPDVDNLVKLVLDALNRSGYWVDDAQVCEIATRKVYAEPEGTWVYVAGLPDQFNVRQEP